jgi:uncharacterized membrane protein YhhN
MSSIQGIAIVVIVIVVASYILIKQSKLAVGIALFIAFIYVMYYLMLKEYLKYKKETQK